MSTFQFINVVLRPPTYQYMANAAYNSDIFLYLSISATGRMVRLTGVAVKDFTAEWPAVLFVSPIRVFCILSTLAEIKYDLQHHHLLWCEDFSTHLYAIRTDRLEQCAHTTNRHNEKYHRMLAGLRAQARSLH
jgi:hypothetical protein